MIGTSATYTLSDGKRNNKNNNNSNMLMRVRVGSSRASYIGCCCLLLGTSRKQYPKALWQTRMTKLNLRLEWKPGDVSWMSPDDHRPLIARTLPLVWSLSRGPKRVNQFTTTALRRKRTFESTCQEFVPQNRSAVRKVMNRDQSRAFQAGSCQSLNSID